MNDVQQCDLLIRNAWVLSMDAERHMYPHGAVAVAGNTIVAVGPERVVLPAYEAKRVIDAGGAAVHPGFIDCHTHPTIHIARGALPDKISFDAGMVWYTHWWNSLDDDDEYAGCLLASLEMICNGTTTYVESGTVLEPDCAARAAEAVGIRAYVADPFLWDVEGAFAPEGVIHRAPPSTKRSLDLLGGQLWRNKDPDALVQGHVAIYGVGTASQELELAAKACADENGTFVNKHQSHKTTDTAGDDARFGKPVLVHLAEHGLLDENCLLVHMNFVRDEEVVPLLDSGASVCWCASTSMFWGIGATFRGRHAELRKLGVNVALGSDSVNSSGRYDVANQAMLALLTTREKTTDRYAMIPEEALEMSTVAGAKAIGMEHLLGSLEPGKRADIVIRTREAPGPNPQLDPVKNLVFTSGSQDIGTVIVDGRVVVEAGRSTLVDHQRVYADVAAAADRVAARMGVYPTFEWPIVE
jgi:5-methylthioadenosine/S-adenosylhomocysteine deaminase